MRVEVDNGNKYFGKYIYGKVLDNRDLMARLFVRNYIKNNEQDGLE